MAVAYEITASRQKPNALAEQRAQQRLGVAIREGVTHKLPVAVKVLQRVQRAQVGMLKVRELTHVLREEVQRIGVRQILGDVVKDALAQVERLGSFILVRPLLGDVLTHHVPPSAVAGRHPSLVGVADPSLTRASHSGSNLVEWHCGWRISWPAKTTG